MIVINNFNDIKHLLTKESIIFDIGSNFGKFSELIYNSGLYNKIYLFEPVTEYLNNSKLIFNNDPNIIFINNGLSNRNEYLTLYKDNKNVGWNTFLTKDPMQKDNFYLSMNSEIKEVITLDSFCNENNIKKIDLIKIDVEGFETRVIEGFFNTLERLEKKPYFYIEVGWGNNHPEWDYCNNIYEKLFSIGYKRIEFSNKTKDILFEPIL